MKVYVLGKLGSIVHWAEDAIAGFSVAGHQALFGVTRNPALHPALDRLLLARWTGAPRIARILRGIARFQPDLILAIGPYSMELPILQQVAALPARPPLIGWVGDLFPPESRASAALLDAVAYTDTGLMDLHHRLAFPCSAAWVPHAANPRLAGAASATRDPRMAFVANPTPHRRAMIGAMRSPMCLYGPGWTAFAGAAHDIQARRIGLAELATIYRSHRAVLNIRNEGNVLVGLNQRHFDPYLAATPVLADDQADLERCFAPGIEMLVYRNAEGLNEHYDRLRADPQHAAAIGAAGRRRVLAEHTYAHRLAALARLV